MTTEQLGIWEETKLSTGCTNGLFGTACITTSFCMYELARNAVLTNN
jgi:hypothetical protein